MTLMIKMLCSVFLQVLLIVNVASYCGYTDINYRTLVWYQVTYQPEGFEVLGFPCNQFGDQEPDSHSEILKFAKSNYDLNFRLFSKSDVIGEGRNALYELLYERTGSAPTWNFAKYLVDQNGEVVQFFNTRDTDEEIHQSIRYLLSKEKDEL